MFKAAQCRLLIANGTAFACVMGLFGHLIAIVITALKTSKFNRKLIMRPDFECWLGRKPGGGSGQNFEFLNGIV